MKDIIPESDNFIEYEGIKTPLLVTSVNFDRGFFSAMIYEGVAPVEMNSFQLCKIIRVIDRFTAEAMLRNAAREASRFGRVIRR